MKGESWPLELRYDVDFIAGMPCHEGPHGTFPSSLLPSPLYTQRSRPTDFIPPVLFWDFAYRAIKVDTGLVHLNDWALQSRPSSNLSTAMIPHVPSPPPSHIYTPPPSSSSTSHPLSSGFHSNSLALLSHPAYRSADPNYNGVEKVLVIEALGVSDNEVFARAWCAHWGFSAIVANIRETCMACAIREAYAAQVCVVILTEGGRRGVEDDYD